MCGIGVYEIRILCESQWEGGGGYTPQQVGDMTPDQVYLRLIDKRRLRGGGIRQTMRSADAAELSGGRQIRGRLENGEVFYACSTGGASSVAGAILEREKQNQEEQNHQEQRRERHRMIEEKSEGGAVS